MVGRGLVALCKGTVVSAALLWVVEQGTPSAGKPWGCSLGLEKPLTKSNVN